MKAFVVIAALTFATPAIAAGPAPQPVSPAPATGVQKVEKKDAPLRLHDPLMIDDRRHQLVPPGRLPGSNKPMPKNGAGPEIG